MIEEKVPERLNPLVAASDQAEDQVSGEALRPRALHDFVGQTDIKKRLAIALEAARHRGEPPDHMLFSGPPGLGKTTLASIVGYELHCPVHSTSGPAIERAGDLAAVLTKLSAGDVLFIDEIHRINRNIGEVLYSAMEDFRLDITLGRGPSAQSVRIDLPRFTLIGATTRTGLLAAPLRDRFGHHLVMEYYQPDEMLSIITRSAAILEIECERDGALEMARRGRGTPRIVNRILRRVRDYAQVRANNRITLSVVREALDLLGIDELGLDTVDRRLMDLLCSRYRGTPVGLKNLAVTLGEDQQTLEEVYEPYLIKIGFIIRSPRGRLATADALAHFLGEEARPQGVLF